jgi:hypothetical protein
LRLTKKLTEFKASFVELGFAVAGGAVEHSGDLVVFEAFDVVEDEDHAIAGRERSDGALESNTVDRAGELEVAAAKVALGCVLFGGVDGLFKRDEVEALFAQMHQDQIYRKSMKPRGEGGFTTEAADLAEEMEEGLLGHVFGFGDVAEHAEAEGVDAAFVKGIELGERLGVSVFGCFYGFCFADDGRIALEYAWGGGVSHL